MKKHFTLSLLLAVGVTTAYSQRIVTPDYLLTATGDSLSGKVRLKGRQTQSLHLRRKGKEPADFAPEQVIRYGDANEVLGVSYPMARPQGPVRVVVPILKGPVSLFSGENELGQKRFYLQPRDSAYLVEISPLTPRLAYLRVLTECPSLDFSYSRIEEQYLYNYSGLSRLVQTYNTCRYPEQPSTLIKQPGGLQAHVGFKGGVHTTRFRFDNTPAGLRVSSPATYQAGVFLNVSSKRALSLQMEALYTPIRSTYGPYEIFNGYAAYTTTRTINIKYTQVQLPVLLRYTVGKKYVRPYLNAGPVYSFNIQGQSEETFQDSDKPTMIRKVFEPTTGNSLGGALGAGVLLQYTSFPQLSLEARAEHYAKPTYTTLRLDVGIAF